MMHHDSFFIDVSHKSSCWSTQMAPKKLSLQKPWWAGGSQSSKTTHRTHYAWCLWTFEKLRWIPICLKKRSCSQPFLFVAIFLMTFLPIWTVNFSVDFHQGVHHLRAFPGEGCIVRLCLGLDLLTRDVALAVGQLGLERFRCGVLHVTRHPGEGWRLGGIVRAQSLISRRIMLKVSDSTSLLMASLFSVNLHCHPLRFSP